MIKHRLTLLASALLLGHLTMAQKLIHYWSFNNNASLVTMLTPDSTIGGGAASYTIGTNGTTQSSALVAQSGAGDFTGLNVRNNAGIGNQLRFNSPANGSLVFSVPTTGYKDPVLKYETYRSGQGAREQRIYYSTNGGTDYTPFENLVINETPDLKTLNFSAIDAADNNADFRIKIEFAIGAGGNTDGNGNNRMDNLTVDASLLSDGPSDPVSNVVVSFDKVFYTVNEDAGSVKVQVNVSNPTTSSVKIVSKGTPWSTASSADFTSTDVVLNITPTTNLFEVTIPINNDTDSENDEYFVLALESESAVNIGTNAFATIYIKDNDKKAPTATEEIELEHITSFDPSTTGSTTEAIAYDPQTKRVFATSAIQGRVDIIDFANPANPATIKSIDLSPYGGVTGIAAKNGVLAVASPNANEQANGSVVLFDTEGNFKKQLTVGALPDFIGFTPDGTKLLIANEGQPKDVSTDLAMDPEGSVSVINMSAGLTGVSQSDVTTITFTSLNDDEAALLAKGVRKTTTTAQGTLAQDLEPEYITVSADSKKAWVVLQENNAMMEINLENLTITDVWGLGTKDYSLAGNGADVSDNNKEILISNWPVKGYYMPDGISSYSVNGVNYIVTANEGDEKEYKNLNERAAVSSITLDETAFPNAKVLQQSHNLGRFRISNIHGDTDGDGDFDELYAVGARSFSIFNADTKTLVYDSGDDFEYITAKHPVYSPVFNANHEESNTSKNRSRAKGSEPEAAAVAKLDGKDYAFIGLERVGGVMVYNVTDPQHPVFVDYKNTRTIASHGGDLGPEYVVVVKGTDSPDGKTYVLVSNEISGTITVFRLKGVEDVSTNLEDKELASSFYVYPNPVKGAKLNLSRTSNVRVETINGQKVLEESNTKSLDVSHLNSGLYILKTSDGEVRKFIVE